MSERPTIRPVTLPRLVEVTNLCENSPADTELVETELAVSHKRARETILEACRVNLLSKIQSPPKPEATEQIGSQRVNDQSGDGPWYSTTEFGEQFLMAVRAENWMNVSEILENQSPHYEAFLQAVETNQPAPPETILERLNAKHDDSQYDFNEASIDIVGDWGERLDAIQRNAFTGAYYRPSDQFPTDFAETILAVFNQLEDSTGVTLSQRYLSIPELREHTCEQIRCTRTVFDDALRKLATQNVGKVELSGAPVDTVAKDATLGIKQIDLAESDGLVSTSQSTERVMAGIEQHGKQYYYLAIHDDNLTYTQEENL